MTNPVLIRIPTELIAKTPRPPATPLNSAAAKLIEERGPEIIGWFVKEIIKANPRR